MQLNDLVHFADTIAPFDSAAEWDNVGLLVGAKEKEINKALMALDITPAAVEEAHLIGAGLIISHHPVIFSPISRLLPDSAEYLLAKYDIAALCLHTDLDRAQNGVNVALGNALGLKNTVFYPDDFLLVGEPETPCDADQYAAFIKVKLSAPSVRYTDGKVTRIAVSSGGGGEGVELYERYGFDAFVTGEMKHHQYLFAAQHGIAAFDAGHFSTENVVIEPLKQQFAEEFPAVEFLVSQVCTCPYRAV